MVPLKYLDFILRSEFKENLKIAKTTNEDTTVVEPEKPHEPIEKPLEDEPDLPYLPDEDD